MKAIIIEDDSVYELLLKDYCARANISVLASFSNPLKALEYLKTRDADLIFLDIHLPDLNGFDLIPCIKDKPFIITTQDKSKAIEAFDNNAIDFLLKPIEFSRFLQSVQKAFKLIAENKAKDEDYFYVNINKRLVKVNIPEINYVSAKGNYIHINSVSNGRLIVHTTLKKIEELLPAVNFRKVHRSFIVNVDKIVDIEDSTIVIDKKVIPVGKKYRNQLLTNLKLLN